VAIWLLRALFVMCAAATAFAFGSDFESPFGGIILGLVVSVAIVTLEALVSAKPIALVSTLVFGTLVGLLFATLAQRVVMLTLVVPESKRSVLEKDLNLALTVVFIYLGIAFLYHTRDKFRVLIPYVEFRREEKGTRPVLLDTNVLVDGRVAEVLGTGIIDGPIVVPQIVLQELHNLADSDEKLRRERGRLGMRVLEEMRKNPKLEIRIEGAQLGSEQPADQQLIQIAKKLSARIMTNDYNLNRLATLEGIEVINLNELSNALKPVALPDERLSVKLLRPGEQPGQAVGYLQDGTMVVVEDAQRRLGEHVDIVVTNTITRETGRMIFGRLASARAPTPSSRDR